MEIKGNSPCKEMCLMKSHANAEEEIIERVPRRFCKQIPDALENKQISNDDAKFF